MEIDQNTMSISPVIIYNVVNDGALERRYEHHCRLEIELIDPETFKVQCFPDGAGDGKSIFQFNVTQDTDTARFGKDSQVFSFDCENICIRFYQSSDVQQVRTMLDKLKGRNLPSVFNQRTEETSASQYFQFYGYLSQQQNMLMDYVRTSTYQKAVFNNLSDFENKIVLDVGAGSGILSFFAAQAGAKKVYAVEASNMAQFAQQLVKSNKLESVIQVVAGKIEEITLPEKVDIIISEPMGYMLYNERMLETYIHAKKWLAPGGKMFPSRADLHVAPFRDDALYSEQFNKANFWCNTQFHGVDLSSMYNYAMKEYFRQPVVDTFDIRCCISKSVRHSVDFLTANESDLHKIYIPLEFHILESGTCHGLAFWFDVEFCGSTQQIWLSTAPTEPLTHWYQVRCLLLHPIYLKQGQLVTGNVLLVANKKQSYDVTIHLNVEGTLHTSTNTMDLKNPYFRYTGSTISTTVNQNSTITSNTESDYWNTIEPQFTNNKNNNLNAYNLTNGIELPSLDISLTLSNTNLLGAGNPQPDIHPGCISSTGRGGATAIVNMNGQSSGNILPANVINNTANLPSIGLGTSGLGSILNNGLASVPLGTGGLNLLSGNLTQVGGATTSGLIAATSTQSVAQQQLIGGAISPSLFITTTTPLVTGPGAASAFQQPGIQPLDLNSLLVAPQVILAPAALSSANGAPNPHL